VVAWARSAPAVDVLFADPPYAFDGWVALGTLRARLFVAESDREVDLGGQWRILRSKRYGGTVVTLFEPRSEPL
jgi:16S rRNA (guanine966-N2)-methyltransferase